MSLFKANYPILKQPVIIGLIVLNGLFISGSADAYMVCHRTNGGDRVISTPEIVGQNTCSSFNSIQITSDSGAYIAFRIFCNVTSPWTGEISVSSNTSGDCVIMSFLQTQKILR